MSFPQFPDTPTSPRRFRTEEASNKYVISQWTLTNEPSQRFSSLVEVEHHDEGMSSSEASTASTTAASNFQFHQLDRAQATNHEQLPGSQSFVNQTSSISKPKLKRLGSFLTLSSQNKRNSGAQDDSFADEAFIFADADKKPMLEPPSQDVEKLVGDVSMILLNPRSQLSPDLNSSLFRIFEAYRKLLAFYVAYQELLESTTAANIGTDKSSLKVQTVDQINLIQEVESLRRITALRKDIGNHEKHALADRIERDAIRVENTKRVTNIIERYRGFGESLCELTAPRLA